MVAFGDLFQLPTRAAIKARVITLAEAAQLRVTSWIPGEPSERWIELTARVVDAFMSTPVTQVVRAFFFDLNTDPGDAGDLASDQTPRPGWLSAFGSGWWGVDRGDRTYAPGFVTLTNDGDTPATFEPYDLTLQRSTPGSDGGYPTYRNSDDSTIYAGGSVTLAPGASLEIPIIAEQPGTYASASVGQVSVVVTGSFGDLTCTNAAPVVGSDREARTTYIARCRQQSAAASPHGPSEAYAYASTTGSAGAPLQLYDGTGATTVNRWYVSPDSSTGQVLIYLANPTGPATTAEVRSANANINGIAVPDPVTGEVHNLDPIGVVPDGITPGPTVSDAVTGAPGPAAATATNIGPIKGTARIKSQPGVPTTALIREVHEAIAPALATYFADIPIGGLDQVAGAGVVYRSDIATVVKDAYPVPVAGQLPAPKLYGVNLTVPASSTTVISLGHVAVLVSPPTISLAVDNGSGLIRLTVSSSSALTTGVQIQIYDAETTGGLELLGTWTVTNIDATHVDLQGSTFPGGGGFISASMSLIIVTVVA